ncbi:MAG: DUF2147 domain-containing protein, partial [Pseudomonadota bacterium]
RPWLAHSCPDLRLADQPGGEIIRPGDGDRYSSKLRLVGEGLEVKGCVAAGLICQAQIWTRVR